MLLNTLGLLKFNSLFKIILVFTFGIFFSSCQKKDKEIIKTETGYALGTTYHISYENIVSTKNVNFKKEIERIISAMNESMSTYIPTSDISKINKGDSSIVVDNYFKEVFLKSKEIWKHTNGAFDPTVGSLVNAWGFGPGKKLNTISEKQIDSILTYVGFDKLLLNSDNKIIKKHPQIFLDFNALAKGYTIDLIGKLFDKHNISNYLIELGGEIIAKGNNPSSNKSWIVAIDDPTQENITEERKYAATLELINAAMATSGNYRKFRIDSITGERYVHTVNPKTGYTKKSQILSASVIAPSCMEADAYATAFMAMELEQTKKLLKALKHIEAYILISDSENKTYVFATNGFKELLRN